LPLSYDPEILERMKTLGLQMRNAQNQEAMAKSPDFKPLPYELTESRKRMAFIPKGKVHFPLSYLWVPIVTVNENVHILPGVPKLFKALIDSFFESQFQARPFHRRQIATSMFESDIANALTDIQALATPHQVTIGSYPKWKPEEVTMDEWKVKVVVSIVGSELERVNQYADMVREAVHGFEYKE
jgi:molybdopterin-biosynthesis enzyme MoeA-like protein